MNNNTDEEEFLCFVCWEQSTNKEICTNCGARMQSIDLESATITPPQKIIYTINFNDASKGTIISAIQLAQNNSPHRFIEKIIDDGIEIESSDIALFRLAQHIAELEETTEDEVLGRIIKRKSQ